MKGFLSLITSKYPNNQQQKFPGKDAAAVTHRGCMIQLKAYESCYCGTAGEGKSKSAETKV